MHSIVVRYHIMCLIVQVLIGFIWKPSISLKYLLKLQCIVILQCCVACLIKANIPSSIDVYLASRLFHPKVTEFINLTWLKIRIVVHLTPIESFLHPHIHSLKRGTPTHTRIHSHTHTYRNKSRRKEEKNKDKNKTKQIIQREETKSHFNFDHFPAFFIYVGLHVYPVNFFFFK